MKKIFFAFVIIIIAISANFLLKPTSNSLDNNSKFFSKELTRAGVERVGQPIEGFSASIYLEAFPGIVEEDFDEVQSLEGVYKFDGSKLSYTRTKGQPITSAEDVISDKGYSTLLANLSKRLEVEIKNEADIATLLEKIRETNVNRKSYINDDFSINQDEITQLDSGVKGKVLLGPICPVQRIPPDPNCEDKGFKTTIQVRLQDPTKNSIFTSVDTDEEGGYIIALPPGEYKIQALGGKPFPTCNSRDITIKQHAVLEIDLSCDTGIR